ncbi:MAG: ribulose-phosphate 3-epimerase [Firmicutes bacterium]|nr:ribulose-phosphate 3-epimerase [Bacillota bacterium]
MKNILSPSLLAADFTKLGQQLEQIEKGGAQYIHLDVMDGIFVPNISFGIPVIQSIRKSSNLIFDVHLMIVEPERYVEAFRKAGADIINFHIEATKDAASTLSKIKSLGAKTGITIKPNTPVSEIVPYLENVDMVLIMTVEPGFGGQKFMADKMEKVTELVKIREQKNLKFDIEIDGGVNINNVKEILDTGVNVIVAGSAVFGAEDVESRTKEFLNILQEK